MSRFCSDILNDVDDEFAMRGSYKLLVYLHLHDGFVLSHVNRFCIYLMFLEDFFKT